MLTKTAPDTTITDKPVTGETPPQAKPVHNAKPVPQSRRKWHWSLLVATTILLGLASYWYMSSPSGTQTRSAGDRRTNSSITAENTPPLQLITTEEGIAYTPLLSSDRSFACIHANWIGAAFTNPCAALAGPSCRYENCRHRRGESRIGGSPPVWPELANWQTGVIGAGHRATIWQLQLSLV